jgi:hypothetical protein
MIRKIRSFTVLAVAAVGSLVALGFAAAPRAPGRQREADGPQQVTSPAGPSRTQSLEETSDNGPSQAVVQKWKRVLGEWHKEDSPEPADNSFCYVCHLNYDGEDLVKTHQKVGVGCETCHGMSDKHSEDEDSVTPPDIMFPTGHIMTFCMECHEKKDLVKEDSHDELFGDGAKPNKTCMDCHGEKHELKVRTRRWDKLTGKLIWDDGVRMMEQAERP